MRALVGMVNVTLMAQTADKRVPFRTGAPVVAVRVSDDDRARPAAISPAQIKRWVDCGNRVFASAGIDFVDATSDGMIERESMLSPGPTNAIPNFFNSIAQD